MKTSTLITTDRGHSHLALGEGEQGPVTKTITIRNTSDKPVTYDLGVRYSVATGGEETHDPTFMEAKADVTFSKDTVTVPAGSSETVDVTFSEDFGQNGIIHGGWITVTDPMEEHTVPFAGMSGDYQALPLLVDGGMGLPALGKAKGDSVDIAGKHPTYTMQGDDRPYIIYRLNLPAETAKLEIFTANADGSKGAPVHPKFNTAWEDQHVTKSADYFIADWTGEVQGNNGNNKSRTVPSGDYVMELKVLKPMGDPKNPAHWETWESGSFTIDRPGEKQNPGKGKKPAKPGKGNGKG
ncbi:Fn3-like domain-containing protein [Helcobacillus massiliensis]|nr:Fn3-like domain-containing protein [Helcobacillus massiliensis]